jgi:ATP-binding cassette subfamily B protein
MAEKRLPMHRGVGMPKINVPKGTFKRVMKYVFKNYKIQVFLVILCLIISGAAGSVASTFTQSAIDDVVIPGLSTGFDSVKAKLYEVITKMIVCYSLGVVASLIYTQTMAIVTQSLLYRFRKDTFDKMESLPISYFDTHQHGEIMSTYTNDIDAIRQLIGQSIPNLFL